MEETVDFYIRYDRIMHKISMWESHEVNAATLCDYNWKTKEGEIKVATPLSLIDIIEKCPKLAYDAIHGSLHIEVTIKWDNHEINRS